MKEPFIPQSDQAETTVEKQPEVIGDKFAIFYFMWIGGAAGLGWHAVVNSFDYFEVKFPGYDVSFIYPLAPYVAQLFTTFVITQISNVLSYSTRVIISLCILLALTIFMPFQADILKESGLGMNMSMVLLFVLGFNNTLCYASVAGMTSKINGKYTAYFLIGVAIFGLVMNLIKELTLLTFATEEEEDIMCVIAYFSITAFLIFGGLIFHAIFLKTEFCKTYCNPRPHTLVSDVVDAEVGLLPSAKANLQPQKSLKNMLDVFKQTKVYMFMILVACIQQNLVYPGVMLRKPIDGMAGHTKTVSMITTFSVFYILGKKLGQYRKYYNEIPVVLAIALRFALLGFFIIEALTIDIPIFNTIWFGYVNIAIFAITMGFLNVSLFIMAPEKVEGEKKEIAGFLAVFFINFGSMVGGFASLGLKDLGV